MWKQEKSQPSANKLVSLFVGLTKGLFVSIGNVFTMFVVTGMPLPLYILYWIVMFIENTVMMSMWHFWSETFGFWYHDIVVRFVITAYAASFLIKFIHCCFYKPNRETGNILKWYFCKTGRYFAESESRELRVES